MDLDRPIYMDMDGSLATLRRSNIQATFSIGKKKLLIQSTKTRKEGGGHTMAEFRQAKHTIILVQYTRDPNSRTYLDFESVNGGMDGVVKMYEAKLKQLNPDLKNITYDIQDLYTYIDSLTDLSALVLDLETKTYLPCGKEWIKKKVFQVLKNQAA
ncbi:unnamed protein product [Peronospora farinosa]|uniref:Enhancer of rudimentary homolog n=1 Tax=Peronospora farinosa TaxID=134698 RepID=A0AAV0TDX8_9STRA|nr:unnamed protein product [Peronospora farinosa]CAI5717824.1 unnamed protein product [Peronospora farinosa]